ncbi:DUF2599 domain-containing protein [Microbacterium radiodurans]|nr:DUF2599 domain-containing protein [Microbacterium radiodurans]
MSSSRLHRATSILIGAASLLSGVVAPPPSPSDPNEAVAAVATVAPFVLDDLAHSSVQKEARSSTSAIDVIGTDSTVSLPQHASDPLIMRNGAAQLSLVLPIENSDPDTVGQNGLTSYPAGDDASIIPAIKNDGSVQLAMVLEGPNAPHRYDYSFSAGSTLRVDDNGVIVVSDAAGVYSGIILPPWALDASGATVPTHFEVAGNVLTQVVEHAGSAYPVVADPYAGQALISSVTTGSENGYPRYSVRKTTFGQSISLGYGLGGGDDPLLGAAIMRDQGWIEAVSKGLSTAATIRQQYDCHTLYAAAKNPWNLERWRGTNDWWGVNPQACNWN